MTHKYVLAIDNEQYIQEIIQICLETVAGWQVITASSGQEGLSKAEKNPPDAILLDVMMTDMDGLETFAKLQQNPLTQNIPVILLTAKTQPSDRPRYQELGIKATITKPFEPLELAAQISEILGWSL